jgi:hypothetical protein
MVVEARLNASSPSASARGLFEFRLASELGRRQRAPSESLSIMVKFNDRKWVDGQNEPAYNINMSGTLLGTRFVIALAVEGGSVQIPRVVLIIE